MADAPLPSKLNRIASGPDTNVDPAVAAQFQASAQPGSKAPAVEVTHRNRHDSRLLDLVEGTTDAKFHYRWVRSRKDENHMAVSRAKLKGYTPVLAKEGVKTVVESDNRPDGTIAIGDLILMKCTKERHGERVTEKRRYREQLLASASAETEEMARQKGVQVIKDPDHNREVNT